VKQANEALDLLGVKKSPSREGVRALRPAPSPLLLLPANYVKLWPNYVERPIPVRGDRGEVAAGLGGAEAVPRHRRPEPPEVLLPRDVSVPVRAHSHGSRAQLRDRRPPRPLQRDARLQRAPPDGLGRLRPARRER